ncbi:MAG: acyl-CoA mutase large subunit family protein [Ignavibacteriales bacterium]|nr:acyl-CoA mutase large subunit family protein [Ignavibacteriales bacterium]
MSNEIPTDDFKLDNDLNLKSEFTPPSFEEWKAQVEKDLKGASYEKKLITKTYEGINLQPIYTKDDLENLELVDTLPGFDNFVRGFSSTGYHKKTWTVNQEIKIADSDEFNTALKLALENGQNCVNLCLDSATKLGLDADYTDENLVGDTGLSISAIKSLERALKNIDLTKNEISIYTGKNVLPFLSLFNSYLKSHNIDSAKLTGSISADPINELVKSGTLEVSEDFLFNSLKIAIEWTKENSPNLKVIGINTLPYVNAGASSVQELAIAISTFVHYVNNLSERGVSAEDVFSKTIFTFGISSNYFMDIAKFRAIRVLLENIAENYQVELGKCKPKISAKSSDYYQTNLDPYVNMLRSTTQAFSAIVGGVDSITTLPFDETIRKSDNFSRRIARNIHTILREESHLDQVIDPAGGSYFIETLTEELAKSAWNLFKQIENNGGILESLKNNFIQTEIEKVADERSKDINKRKSVIVGTNMFADIKEKKLEKDNFDKKSFYNKRAEYLKKFRLNETNEKHSKVMEKLQSISLSSDNKTIDLMTDAFSNGATLGEINSALISSYKSGIKIEHLKQRRASQEFENLRENSLKYKEQNGSLPQVFLANWGTLNDYKGRADFSKGFFEVGGFEVIESKGSTDFDELVNICLNSKAPIITICSTDDNYPEIVPQIVSKLKSKNQNLQIILAGYPKDQIEEHKKNGIEDFIYLGADVMEKLTSLLTKIGGIK